MTLAKSLQSAAGNAAGAANYIEDVFSTYLYTGNGSTQTITNGIDLAGEGGLVWGKDRTAAGQNFVYDTARGATNALFTNLTNAQNTGYGDVTSFNSNGFTLNAAGGMNLPGDSQVSWTFRKQPKFFDVVTYTGNGSSSQTISHDLGSVPGCVIIKRTDSTSDWYVYHRGHEFAPSEGLALNLTSSGTSTYRALLDVPTSTTFTTYIANTNTSGATYVAYLFAHNAGGFGESGEENVISCGSYTGNSSTNGPTVTLGYEPQWVMIKNITTGGAGYDWLMADNMRGIPMSGNTPLLAANLSSAENTGSQGHAVELTATGFKLTSPYGALNNTGNTYIYIAIRRGPMKVPESGTEVFAPVAYNADGTYNRIINTTITPDMIIDSVRNIEGADHHVFDRLRGWPFNSLWTNSTSVENVAGDPILANPNQMNSIQIAASGTNYLNAGSSAYIVHAFRRAPGFMDVCCYTGNATSGATQTHNLGVVPEMMIVKNRSAAGYDWFVYHKDLTSPAFYLNLNTTAAESQYWNAWNSTQPTSSVFTIGNYTAVNASGNTYVAYLFATCVGVSKVGSYTGTGTTQQINCGFTSGARFVMIKRTDSTGDWYVWDTARGIVAGNDPYLLLNSTAAEVTSTDYIDPVSSGFEISSTAPASINASGGSFIFLAIA